MLEKAFRRKEILWFLVNLRLFWVLRSKRQLQLVASPWLKAEFQVLGYLFECLVYLQKWLEEMDFIILTMELKEYKLMKYRHFGL